MTREELIPLLSGEFYENFADTIAAQVVGADAFGTLYDVVTSPGKRLPTVVRHKVFFRGAYVMERIYFAAPERFAFYAERFCRTDFPACADASARRHFTKIMAHLLCRYTPDAAALDRIAETAAQWAVDPGAKVAVRIGAVEVLKCCRGKVGWVAEAWADLLEAVALDTTPGIASRMRKSWK